MRFSADSANRFRFIMAALAVGGVVMALPAQAEIIVGPGAVVGPVNVNVEGTTIVGDTTVTSSGTMSGANVTGFQLTLDSLLGPSPGAILIQTVNGNALNANGGNITSSGNVQLLTQNGHGVYAGSASSTVTLNGTGIQTTGTGAGLAAIGGFITATDVTINNLGNSTPTVSAGHGAIAESGGTIILNTGTSIATGAFNAVGLGVSGAGSVITTTSAIPVVMNGRGAMGIYLHDGGQVSLANNFVLQMNASNGVGITADNTDVTAAALGSGITMNFDTAPISGQAGGTGVVAINNSQIALEDLTVQGVGAGAGVWARQGSTVTLTGDSILDINADANPTFYTLQTAYLVTASGSVGSVFGVTSGLPIGGLISNNATIDSTGTTINVSSSNGVGAYAGFNTGTSTIDMTNNTITTTGAGSYGIQAGENGRITGDNVDVSVSGGGAALFLSTYDTGFGSIDLTNGSFVEATGAGTAGLSSLNLSSGLTSSLKLGGGSTLRSAEGAVIFASGGALTVEATDSELLADNGLLVDAQFNASAPQLTDVTLTGVRSVLEGDIQADTQSFVHMDLSDDSSWSGAALNATSVALASNAEWIVTGNSALTNQLSNNGGIVRFSSAGGVKTVTTTDYVGTGGVLIMQAGGSTADRLVIDGGAATGTTSVLIQTTGVLTPSTANGIMLVDTVNGGTTAANAFTLYQPVTSGAYGYDLVRGSVDNTNAEAWFLRVGALSKTSLYAAMPSMALALGKMLVPSIHEHAAELKDEGLSDDYWRGAWVRVVGQHGKNEGSAGPDFDYDAGVVQMGKDIYRNDSGSNIAGVYGAFGHLSGDVEAAGSNTLRSHSLGVYWAHFTPSGLYVNSTLQGSHYRAEGGSLKTDGLGFAASVESGQPLDFGGGVTVEPQVRLTYEAVDFDDANDGTSAVAFENVNSLSARVGLRVEKKWKAPKEIAVWATPSYGDDFRGRSKTVVSGSSFRSDVGGNWAGLDLGAEATLAPGVTGFASAQYESRFGDGYAYGGTLGVKAAF